MTDRVPARIDQHAIEQARAKVRELNAEIAHEEAALAVVEGSEPSAPLPPTGPHYVGSRSGVVYERVPTSTFGRAGTMLRRTERTWSPPKAPPSRHEPKPEPPSIRSRILSASTPDDVATIMLEAATTRASSGTRLDWRRAADARLDHLEAERLKPDMGPRVVLA